MSDDPTDETSRRLTRIADARMARRADEMGAAAPSAAPPSARDGVSVIGDRVLDVATGLGGEVLDVGRVDNLGRTPITVRLDDNTRVTRLARDLIARPRRPAAR
jgi:hypothetical protein